MSSPVGYRGGNIHIRERERECVGGGDLRANVTRKFVTKLTRLVDELCGCCFLCVIFSVLTVNHTFVVINSFNDNAVFNIR